MKTIISLSILSILFLFTSQDIFAAEEQSAGHKSGHEYHKHHVAYFAGVTTGDGETDLTQGLDYEYRFSSHLGAGLILDFAFASELHTLIALPVIYHVNEHLELLLAPGLGLQDGESYLSLRLGVSYTKSIGGAWTLGPNVNLDVASGEVPHYIYGLILGYGF